jgi:hypothetical protein
MLFFIQIKQLLVEDTNRNLGPFPEGYVPLADVTIQKKIVAFSWGTIKGRD